MKKNTVAKSVRFSPDDVAYIESREGSGFTDKLQGILEEFRKGDKKRAEELAWYDGLIAGRRRELKALTELLYLVSDIRRKAVYIESELSRIEESLKKEGGRKHV